MKQTCILILGMHRSGTSALTGTLELLDVYLGLKLNKPLDENPKGFYENTYFTKINEKLLKQIDSSWDDVFYNKAKLNLVNDTLELEKVLKQEFQNNQFFAIKDPRLAYLFPLYINALTNLGVDIKIIIPFRNPLEVAHSLNKRNNFSQEKGLLLWAYHFLLSEYQSRNFPRVFTHFDELVQSPEKVIHLIDKKLELNLTSKYKNNEAKLHDFLTPELKHHNIAFESLSEKVPKIIQQIVSLVPKLNEADLSKQLDVLRNQLFDNQSLFYNPDIINSLQELEQAKQGLQTKDEELEQVKQGLQTKVQELEQAKKYLIVSDEKLKNNLRTIEKLNEEKHAIYMSNSWRVTSPMRVASNIAKKVLSIRKKWAKPSLPHNLEGRFKKSIIIVIFKPWWLMRKLLSSGKVFLRNSLRKELTPMYDSLEGHDKKWELPLNDAEHRLIMSPLCEDCKPIASLIILNRNGAKHLKNLLSSFQRHHDPLSYELIIVDHNSDDESQLLIESYMEKLPIKLLIFGQNNSFSFANNIGAKYSISDILVFCNNDIIYDKCTIPSLVNEFEDPTVGGVSLPLYYADESGNNTGRLQHAGIGLRVDNQFAFARPYNLQKYYEENELGRPLMAVTAALMACRKVDFEAVSGFNEGYHYGYEDVDLCLSLRSKLGKSLILSNNVTAIHDESASQKKDDRSLVSSRRLSNIKQLKQRYGKLIDRLLLLDKSNSRLGQTFNVGLVVTEDDPETTAGDYFTALEFSLALESEFGWHCKFLPRYSTQKDWYDVQDLDCIIVFIDNYDLRKIYNASYNLIKVAWLRNWFDRWTESEWFPNFDIYLCSSEVAKAYIEDKTGNEAQILRIACNAERFKREFMSNSEYACDYCFTGSYWGAPRDIEHFEPDSLPYRFNLYGSGWENHRQFANSYKGCLPYSEIAKVYSNTRILIDDANHVTKPWASVNSRVFDALASGVLVITNGRLGAEEIFQGLLPVYEDMDDLKTKLSYYLEHEDERKTLVEKLYMMVTKEHTYRHRAIEFKGLLDVFLKNAKRLAIKLPVPKPEIAYEWGDFHLAKGLARALRLHGYLVRLDTIQDWYTSRALKDNIVLTIRGLSQYKPETETINLMWQISHPDKVKNEEYLSYDHIFVASQKYMKTLQEQLDEKSKISLLLQCTDPELFYFQRSTKQDGSILFVGNSRKQFRPILKHAIESGLDVKVYGTRWEEFIDVQFIKGQHIDYAQLPAIYSNSSVLLNDHWNTMSEHGFISNRLFDAAACGAVIVSDRVEGINKLFDGLVYEYNSTPEDLKEKTSLAMQEGNSRLEERRALAEKIAKEHSFTARADTIHKVITRVNTNNLIMSAKTFNV